MRFSDWLKTETHIGVARSALQKVARGAQSGEDPFSANYVGTNVLSRRLSLTPEELQWLAGQNLITRDETGVNVNQLGSLQYGQ